MIDRTSRGKLKDLLAEHDGVVSFEAGRWVATVSLEESDPALAAAAASALVESMAVKAGMPHWPTVRIEAVREDIFHENNARLTLPALVSVPEAAQILGVSPQRIHELAASSNREFPEPVYDLKVGKLWLRDRMKLFAELRDHKRGPRDRSARLRERATSTLLDSGLTVMDAKVWLSHDRNVILQLEAYGPRPARRRVAAKIITALSEVGLGVTDEGSHSAEDMEGYLADGHTAEIYELREEFVHREQE